ncbi:phage tail protein [Pseudocitrobacter sp. 2023EL-00150]|uniref:phage tail protein n=1 Tax=Pseudocitrobacter sp. 2023EL-00150 TaxID=3032322 RepID=UPI0023E460E1|nr:phage tail protein [Pseudocitrobacter sp. 2023EL-00150]MDF3830231.1 phage tail protein [Pseudocitrobacter sp. 2023EL-00150]
MAIETFSWGIQSSSQPTTKSTDTIRKVQFGDGYTQVAGAGLNDESLTYSYSFTGRPETGLAIYAFLRRHKTKSFSFAPPYGELALWRVEADSLQKTVKSKTVMTITATFEQAFAP